MLASTIACAATGCRETTLDAVGISLGALADGLVAHWTLDDGAGTAVSDSSGNGHDGKLSGGTWISDGRFGSGLRLAAGGAVVVPNFPTATPNWSVSLWLRLSSEQMAADSETFTEILSTETLRSGGWQMNIDKRLAQPRFVFSYWSPPLTDYVGTECSCLDTGDWHQWAAVVDVSSNHIVLYRDGAFADQETRPSDIPTGDSTLHFGGWNMGDRLLNGDLDDIAIWSRELSSDEIAALATLSVSRASH